MPRQQAQAIAVIEPGAGGDKCECVNSDNATPVADATPGMAFE